MMSEEEQKIRVLLVDDHAVIRSGLRFFLSTISDIEVVGEASGGEMGLSLCQKLSPDVVLMDLIMPGMDGITAIKLIKERFPQIQVITLTSFQEKEMIQESLRAGAISYLIKNVGAAELQNTIRMAYEGKSILAPEAVQVLVSTVADPSKIGDDLTERENEVLSLMAEGLSNDQIASKLTVSRNTIRYHVRNILSKLEATNRTKAVSIAVKNGLVNINGT